MATEAETLPDLAARFKVLTAGGRLSVTAPPGAGKTSLMAHKVILEAEHLEESPQRILCLTYTRAGVAALRRKVFPDLPSVSVGRVEITTIHAFCIAQILRPHYHHIRGLGPTFRFVTSESEEYLEAAASIDPDIRLFESARRLSDGTPHPANRLPKSKAIAFWKLLRKNQLIDSPTVLCETTKMLTAHTYIAKSIAARYRWLIVDEFQDTADIQLQILDLIREQGNISLIAIGDPAQSIFGFAGADPESQQRFVDELGADPVELVGTFRCGVNICMDAEKIISRDPPFRPYLSVTHKGSTQIWSDTTSSDAVIRHFLSATLSLEIPPQRTAILCAQRDPLINLYFSLRQAGVSATGDPTRPYRRTTFSHYIECIADFRREPTGDGYRTCLAYLHDLVGDLIDDDHDSLGNSILGLAVTRHVRSIRQDMGAVEIVDAIYKDLSKPNAPWNRGAFGETLEGAYNLMRTPLETEITSATDLAECAVARHSITLSTVHGSKGLEFDAVAIIGVQEGILPFGKRVSPGDLRIFYVAITRARLLVHYYYDAGDGIRIPLLQRLIEPLETECSR